MWLMGQAFAQDWSSFREAFPLFPCQDGWMACEVDGQRLDPGLQRDGAGRVVPSDARLSWFELEPSASFSPFVELTRYPAPEIPDAPLRTKSKSKIKLVPPPIEGECSNLEALEPLALLGRLTVTGCLEERLPEVEQTEKRQISALLLVDAWARKDWERWEALVERHLDEIDQSDPDLCYKYALYLSRQGPERAEGALRWAGVALENRTVWTGETYQSRVFSLYKLRAAAAQSLWAAAEDREEVERLRALTKVTAREWYEYALSAGKPAEQALELCRSAAGTAEYCEVR
jgi:hypothetical protein